MRGIGISFAILAFTAAPAVAQADELVGSRSELVGYGQFGTGVAALYGELGDEFDSQVIRTHLGGGVRINDFSITASFAMGFLDSSNFERDGRDLLSFEYGPEVTYFTPLPNRRTQWYLRAGLHRLLWSGNSQVRRTCEQTGDCAAGFYAESPGYYGYTGKLSTGIHFTLPTRNHGGKSTLYMAFWFDLGYERLSVDIIHDTIGGNMFSATLGIQMGGGRLGDR